MSKVCTGCLEEKDFYEFYRHPRGKNGYNSRCKLCHSKTTKTGQEKSKYDSKRRLEKLQELRDFDRIRSKTPKRIASKRDWSRKRKLIVEQQTPVWADKKAIKQVYESCVVMSKRFNTEFEVDHIIPLKGTNVCGLHVENNLQLLEKRLNLSKRNSLTHWELNRRTYPA